MEEIDVTLLLNSLNFNKPYYFFDFRELIKYESLHMKLSTILPISLIANDQSSNNQEVLNNLIRNISDKFIIFVIDDSIELQELLIFSHPENILTPNNIVKSINYMNFDKFYHKYPFRTNLYESYDINSIIGSSPLFPTELSEIISKFLY